MSTYNEPAAKIANNPSLCALVICIIFNTHAIGSNRIMKSDATLIAEVTRIGMLMLIHDPSTDFSQILCRGVHSKILTMVSAR